MKAIQKKRFTYVLWMLALAFIWLLVDFFMFQFNLPSAVKGATNPVVMSSYIFTGVLVVMMLYISFFGKDLPFTRSSRNIMLIASLLALASILLDKFLFQSITDALLIQGFTTDQAWLLLSNSVKLISIAVMGVVLRNTLRTA